MCGVWCVVCVGWCVMCGVWCVVCVVCVLFLFLRAGDVLFKTRTQYRGVLGKTRTIPCEQPHTPKKRGPYHASKGVEGPGGLPVAPRSRILNTSSGAIASSSRCHATSWNKL